MRFLYSLLVIVPVVVVPVTWVVGSQPMSLVLIFCELAALVGAVVISVDARTNWLERAE